VLQAMEDKEVVMQALEQVQGLQERLQGVLEDQSPIQRPVSLLSSQSVAHIFCTVKQVYSTLSSQSVAQRARQ
jgi:hypothetical protein